MYIAELAYYLTPVFAVVFLGPLVFLFLESVFFLGKKYVTDSPCRDYCFKTVTGVNLLVGRVRVEGRENRISGNVVDRKGAVRDSDAALLIYMWYVLVIYGLTVLWPLGILALVAIVTLRILRALYRLKTKLDKHLGEDHECN